MGRSTSSESSEGSGRRLAPALETPQGRPSAPSPRSLQFRPGRGPAAPAAGASLLPSLPPPAPVEPRSSERLRSLPAPACSAGPPRALANGKWRGRRRQQTSEFAARKAARGMPPPLPWLGKQVPAAAQGHGAKGKWPSPPQTRSACHPRAHMQAGGVAGGSPLCYTPSGCAQAFGTQRNSVRISSFLHREKGEGVRGRRWFCTSGTSKNTFLCTGRPKMFRTK